MRSAPDVGGVGQEVWILGWEVRSQCDFVVLAACQSSIVFVVASRVSTSPLGRVLRAIREDEVFVRSLGKSTASFKAKAFALSAAMASSAGSLYAHYISFIDPTSFTVMESILVISMVVVGGAGSPWGPVIGAFILVSLPEVLRFVGLANPVAANLRQVLYGTLLVIMMRVRPRGLLGRYGFGR